MLIAVNTRPLYSRPVPDTVEGRLCRERRAGCNDFALLDGCYRPSVKECVNKSLRHLICNPLFHCEISRHAEQKRHTLMVAQPAPFTTSHTDQAPGMTSPTDYLSSPVKVWHALIRHKVAAAAFFVCVLALVAAATLLMPAAYHSQSKLFLRLGRENATLDPTATLGQSPVVALPPTRENEINSILEMLKTQHLLQQVVDRVGPEVILGDAPFDPNRLTAPPTPEGPSRVVDDRYRAVVHLAKKVEVEAVKKSNVIQVSYEGASPEVSQAVVGSLVEFYLDEHTRINRTPGSHRFLTEQTNRVRTDLTKAEDAVRALKDETGLVAPEVQRQILVDRIGRLEAELAGTAASVAATEAEIKAFKDRVAALPAAVVVGTTKGLPNQAADTMRAQLYTLQLKELELKAKYPENHPELVLTRQQTAAAIALLAKEEAAREQVTTGPNKTREEAELSLLRQEAALTSHRARAAALEGQLALERVRLKVFTGDQLRLAKLQREADLLDSHYRRFADNLERSQIDQSLEAQKLSNVSVIQPATFDVKPVRPNKLLNAAIGFLLATIGAVGLAVLLDSRASTGSVGNERLPVNGRAGHLEGSTRTGFLTP